MGTGVRSVRKADPRCLSKLLARFMQKFFRRRVDAGSDPAVRRDAPIEFHTKAPRTGQRGDPLTEYGSDLVSGGLSIHRDRWPRLNA